MGSTACLAKPRADGAAFSEANSMQPCAGSQLKNNRLLRVEVALDLCDSDDYCTVDAIIPGRCLWLRGGLTVRLLCKAWVIAL